jgi:hypothetical protein
MFSARRILSGLSGAVRAVGRPVVSTGLKLTRQGSAAARFAEPLLITHNSRSPATSRRKLASYAAIPFYPITVSAENITPPALDEDLEIATSTVSWAPFNRQENGVYFNDTKLTIRSDGSWEVFSRVRSNTCLTQRYLEMTIFIFNSKTGEEVCKLVKPGAATTFSTLIPEGKRSMELTDNIQSTENSEQLVSYFFRITKRPEEKTSEEKELSIQLGYRIGSPN